jgi:serine/threonine-protein kinase HipA
LIPLAAAPERGFRPSLAGFQRKALLGRAGDGTWQLPSGAAPATWILKPDGPHATAANEATCLRLDAACGPPAPETELLDVADVIRNFGDPREVTSLLRRTTFNTAVGNADAHAKNFSILHEPGAPAIRLAPLYDVLSTIALELTSSTGQPVRADTHLGQRVGGQADIRKVTAANLIDEAVSWGLRRRTASAVVTETLDQVLAAISTTPGDTRVLAAIREQAERISRS